MEKQPNHLHYLHFDIAGFTYYDGPLVLCELKPGKKVRLEREEDNKFDPCAVAIYYGESKIGFVPSSMNEDICNFLQMGYGDIFDARIQRVAPEGHPEHQVGVIIYLNKNQEEKQWKEEQ